LECVSGAVKKGESTLGVQFGVLQDLEEGGRRLLGERSVSSGVGVSAGREGVAAVVEHVLREVGGDGVGLNAKVAKHGVGLPASEELDGVLVHAGAEEGSGAAGAEATRTEQPRGDPGGGLHGGSCVAESVGDDGGLEEAKCAVAGEVGADRGVARSVDGAEATGEASEGLAGAEARIVGGLVADLFAPDTILLVSERQNSAFDEFVRHFIQRRVRGAELFSVGSEADIAQAEGLGARGRGAAVGAFGGTWEPEEGDDDEVDGDAVDRAFGGVSGVEGIVEGADDDGVDRVAAGGWVVLVAHGFEEIRE
jgi:hypothetical protein